MSGLPYLTQSYVPSIYFTAFARSFWAMQATWYLYFLNYLSPVEIALVHTLGFVVGLAADVPTGYLADRFGRSRVMAIGLAIFSVGIGSFAFVTDAWQIFAIEIVTQLGLAGISGAPESVLFDLSKGISENSSEDDPDHAGYSADEVFNLIYSKVRMIDLASLILSAVVGGILFQISDRLPWLAMALVCTVAALLAFRIPVVTGVSGEDKTNVLRHTREVLSLFSQRQFRYLIPGILILGGLAFNADWGIFYTGVFEELGLSPTSLGLFLAGVYLVGILVNSFHHRIYSLLENFRGFLIYGGFCVVVLAVGSVFQSTGSSIAVGLLGLYILGSSSFLSYLTSVVSDVTDDAHRSAALSASGMGQKFLYLAVAPAMGYFFSRDQGGFVFAILAGLGLLGILFLRYLRPSRTCHTKPKTPIG